MADRPEMFTPTREFSGWPINGTMRNVGPTLVAMAMTFGLGAEIYHLPACLYVTDCSFDC